MQIEVVISESMIKVFCPYSKSFVDFAHMRNAKWSDQHKCWIFDIRDEFAVRSTLIDIYGTDDYASCEKVDVRINLDGFNTNVTRVFLLGRELAVRRYWDAPVYLGEKVAIIQGGFEKEPKSRRYRTCDALPGTVLEVRDVPRIIAERTAIKDPDHVKILGGINKEALMAEREKLLQRITEIDKLLEIAAIQEAGDEDVIADLEDSIDESPAVGCGQIAD